MTLFARIQSQRRRSFFGVALLLAGASCLAQSAPAASGLRINGFGSVGVVHADAPAGWGFQREIDQPAHSGGTRFDTDSRIGLQINYAASQQFELVGQLLASRRSPQSRDSELVQLAFAAYRPTPDLTLRVGRVNLDLFLLSDYRNVGFAYMFARPPVDFYGSLPTSLDGADITKVWDLDGVQWRAKAFVGRTRSADLVISPVAGMMLSRQADGLMLRAGLSRVVLRNVTSELQPLLDGLSGLRGLPVPAVAAEAAVLRERLDFSGSVSIYASLGASYERDDWSLTAEVTRVNGHRSAEFTGGYIGVGRRIGAWTVYGLASRVSTPAAPTQTPNWAATLAPLVGPGLAQQAQLLGSSAAYAANRGGANQRTYTVGTRWDIKPQLALKLQYDHVRIDSNGGRLWANANLDAGRADLASVVLDFVF